MAEKKYIVAVYDCWGRPPHVHNRFFDNYKDADEYAKKSCSQYAIKATIFKCVPIESWKVGKKVGNLTVFDFT